MCCQIKTDWFKVEVYYPLPIFWVWTIHTTAPPDFDEQFYWNCVLQDMVLVFHKIMVILSAVAIEKLGNFVGALCPLGPWNKLKIQDLKIGERTFTFRFFYLLIHSFAQFSTGCRSTKFVFQKQRRQSWLQDAKLFSLLNNPSSRVKPAGCHNFQPRGSEMWERDANTSTH